MACDERAAESDDEYSTLDSAAPSTSHRQYLISYSEIVSQYVNYKRVFVTGAPKANITKSNFEKSVKLYSREQKRMNEHAKEKPV